MSTKDQDHGNASRYETLIRQAYRKIQELEAKLRATEHRQGEPVAVIGLGCRIPSASGPDAYWRLLRDGVDAIREAPAGRWPASETRIVGGFLDDVQHWDPQFFGISAREARSMDPQQRLLLETAWEALEHAGLAPNSLQGSATGVFLGLMSHDYGHRLLNRDPAEFDAYQATGTSASVASGRIAYTFGFRGPVVTVDTACSSSLVAVHQAIQSLRRGDCDLAIAGGVNVILSPQVHFSYAGTTALSPDGRCKTFSAHASGFGRGEGAGLVVLRRLSDALAARDSIRAVLRGSATNHDGRSSGLTVPNGPAQQDVIRAALRDSGTRPAEVSFVEAHGTGTSLGDPIEAGALGAIYGRERTEPLWIGAVKTNIGHLEGSAGIASLIKVILCLMNDEIPPNLHFDEPTPHIDWTTANLRVPTHRVPWPSGSTPRVAGVSSFGISGTNAHVIVGEAPPVDTATRESLVTRSLHLLPLSARSDAALDAQIERYHAYLSAHPGFSAADICAGAACRRSHFEYRAVVLGQSSAALGTALDALRQADDADVVRGRAQSRRGPRTTFLFAGQGGQYPDMGRGLYREWPVFRDAIDRCNDLLEPELGGSIRSIMYPDDPAMADPRLGQTMWTQPALFALQYALARLWMSWGIAPYALMGHSAGEYVAACLAGVFSLEDGLRLIAARGRLMQTRSPAGRMAVVMAAEEEVARTIAAHRFDVSIAALNGPQNTVVSGLPAEVEAVLHEFATREIETRALDISIASHSALMEEMIPEFRQIAASVEYHPPRMRLISNLHGTEAGAEIARPDYWVEHIRKPVRFATGMSVLESHNIDAFVEIGPRSTLLGMARPCLGEDTGSAASWLPSLRRSQRDMATILDSLARLYVQGATVDWAAFARGTEQHKLDLPTYPFARERHWIDLDTGGMTGPGGLTPSVHPVLGRPARSVALEPGALLFEASPGRGATAYLEEHCVAGEALMPATAYIEMALAAGARASAGAPLVATGITIPRGMSMSARRSVQTLLTPASRGFRFVIASLAASAATTEDWVEHASGHLEPASDMDSGPPVDIQARIAALREELDVQTLYTGFADIGIDYGPYFRGVERIWRGTGEALGRVNLAEGLDAASYGIHPALLDGALQVSFAVLWEGRGAEPYLPAEIEHCRLEARAPVTTLYCHAHVRSADQQSRVFDLTLLDETGEPIGAIQGLHLRRASISSRLRAEHWQSWLYEPIWREQPREAHLDVHAGAAALGARVCSRRPELLSPHGLDEYGEAFAALEDLAVDFTRDALEAMGLSFAPGSRWPKSELAESIGVAPQHRRLFMRLLHILEDAAVIVDKDQAWQVQPEPSLQSSTQSSEQRLDPVDGLSGLRRRAKTVIGAEIELLSRCGPRLPDLLRGADDPLPLIFEDGDLSLATHLYERSPLSARMNELCAAAVGELLERLPATSKLRIVEIGAGTGATTRAVAHRCTLDRIEYLFTDVSPLFLQRAKDALGGAPGLQAQILDIERSPEDQGFRPAQADVVIASNAIHATRDLEQALAHARWLLAPGGVLLLVEATHPQRWTDLTFGLLDGWWRFADRHRHDYPLLAAQSWQQLLQDSGFEAVEALRVSAPIAARAVSPAVAEQTLLVAVRPLSEQASSPAPWLILADQSGVGDRLVAELGSRGARAMLARYQDAEHNLQRLLESHDEVQGIVHLCGLDCAPAPDSAEALATDARIAGKSLLDLAQALAKRASPPPTWIVTRGAVSVRAPLMSRDAELGSAQSLLWGMARTMHEELSNLTLVRLDMDPGSGPGSGPGSEPDAIATAAEWLCSELLHPDGETEVARRGAKRYVSRLLPYPAAHREKDRLPAPEGHDLRLEIGERGSIDNLVLRPVHTPPPGPGEVQIRIHATGLNFRDVLNALGEYPGDPGHLGNECSGAITAVGADVSGFVVGDRVCALAHGSFARTINVDARLVAPLSRIDMLDGATIPVAFLTAAYCLDELARLREGERVLIHAASGGVGQAAIQLALAAGAEVFATASRHKWHVVRAFGVEHIYDSRTHDFADEILADTQGAGVHVVLNSLTGAGFIEKSLSTLAPGGRFVEIGKRGIWDTGEVHRARPDVAYFTVDLGEVRAREPALIARLFASLLPAFSEERLHPLPVTSFDIQDAPAAFRVMQQALHTGKIVLTQPLPVPHSMRADGSYLITGGLGGLGLATASWMAERGAGQLILLGRSAPSAAAQEQIAGMQAHGARVLVIQGDVCDAHALSSLVQGLPPELPLRGIVHCAGALDDGLLVNQSWSRFERVLGPKMLGAYNLHQLTRTCPLDFFVCYSSATSLLGTVGQANHAAANMYLDELAHARRARGLPGQSINWGAWSDVGAAAGRELDEHLARKGMGSISPREGLEVLQFALDSGVAQMGVIPMDWSAYLGKIPAGRRPGFLSELRSATPVTATAPNAADGHNLPLRERLANCQPGEVEAILCDHIAVRVSRLLGMRRAGLDTDRPFNQYGLDSLMAVELKHHIKRDTSVDVPLTRLLGDMTVLALARLLLEQAPELAGAAEEPHDQETWMDLSI